MKKMLLAALLAGALLLTACQYAVVEDETEVVRGLTGAAAEGEAFSPGESAEPLARGSRDENGADDVRALQERLIRLNYLSGKADGIFGAATERALREFQSVNGLPGTGVADPGTLAALSDALAVPKPTPSPTPLASGAKGEDVVSLQKKLIEYGFYTGGADGDFGSKTDAAVKDFQQYLHDSMNRDFPPADPTPTPAPANPLPESAGPSSLVGAIPDSESASAPTDPLPETAAPSLPPEETEAPFVPDGVVTDSLLAYLDQGSFDVYRQELRKGSRGPEVVRLQTRLQYLKYLEGSADGIFGSATESSLRYFQKRSGLKETGAADEATQRLLFSAEAKKSDRPQKTYMLKVDTSKQKVYAYRWANGSYSTLVRTMTCSTGTASHPTPLGTYQAGGKLGRWYYFSKYRCWAQYAYRISGPYYFHSVIYSRKDEGSVRMGSVYNLGSRASHGCVRLSVADAKWIYDNCPAGTTVKIV